jgi:hypothetical protein
MSKVPDPHKGETRQVLNGEYYSNILLVSQKNVPLTTVSEDRANWYVSRNLAEYLSEDERKNFPSQYGKIVRLKFKAKLEDKTDPFYQQIVETQCVVCGCRHGLTLHHVVPSVIRKWFPEEHKNHSHGWCVLLCEKHHGEADKLAQQLHEQEIRDLDQRILNMTRKMREEWANDYIQRSGGIEPLKAKYREKFKELTPQFLPPGFLEDHPMRPQLIPEDSP